MRPAARPDHQDDRPEQARLQARLKTAHVLRPHGDAAGGGPQIVMGEMKKDRAAAPAHARFQIVIHHADDVVESVVAPQTLGAVRRRQTHRPIIGARGGIVAPAVARRERAGARPAEGPAVGPPQPAEQSEAAERRHAVALAALHADPAAAERAGNLGRADSQQAARRSAGRPGKPPDKNGAEFSWRTGVPLWRAVLTRPR
ncbi:hypothetical protein M2322_001375 [Rhodoblastus acidophilus]|nr:hypothetical protein [Rhodoblastus acidophilus]